MSQHARFAPSSAYQWGNCSGSVAAQLPFADRTHPRTVLGDAAHWVVQGSLERGGVPCHGFLGVVAPNGVAVDDEIVEGAQIMVDDVMEVVSRLGDEHSVLRIEQRVYMPSIHAQNDGTPDVAFWAPTVGYLFLWDYKHGHREVRAEGNMQLGDYLNGLRDEFDLDDQRTQVVTRIVQPFCYHSPGGPVDEHCGLLADWRPMWNQLKMKAAEADRDPKLSAGPWCRDCKAVGVCPTARRAVYALIDYCNEEYEMDAMSGADLAAERSLLADGLEVAKARLEAIEDTLHHGVLNGDTSSGLTAETKPGRLEWTVEPDVAAGLASQFGVDIRKKAVLTPTQAKAAAPKEIRPLFEKMMGGVTRRPAGPVKLVPVGESKTARAFKRKD